MAGGNVLMFPLRNQNNKISGGAYGINLFFNWNFLIFRREMVPSFSNNRQGSLKNLYHKTENFPAFQGCLILFKIRLLITSTFKFNIPVVNQKFHCY